MGDIHGRSWRSALAILLILLLVAAACGGGGDDGGGEVAENPAEEEPDDESEELEPVSGGRLVYALNGETNTWNPAVGQWSGASWLVASAIFDPIMYYDADFNLKPFLAESVEPNDDHTVWTITTREGIEFHNGQPLDAAALLANFEAQKASPLLGAVLGPVVDMQVTSERTLEMTMANSWVHFPHLLAVQPGMMAAPEMLADPEGGSHPIGTGPFVFEEWVIDDHLLATKNADYWLGEPYLNEIEYRVLPDFTTRAASIESGDVDAALLTGTPEAKEGPEGTVLVTSDLGEDQEVFLLINQAREPFDDLRVRRAMVAATNTEEISEVITGGLYEPAIGIFDPASPWYVETDYPAYDLDTARELVEQVEAESGPIQVTLSGPTSSLILEGLQLVKEQWEAAGIEVELDTTELASFITTTVLGDYDVAYWQYHGSAHPDGEFVFLHSQYAAPEGQLGLNFSRNVDYEIDEALLEGRYTEDEERLRELYGTVQEQMAEDLPYVFLWHVRDAILTRDHVHDIGTWEMPDGSPGADFFAGRHRFHQIWVE
jgi:peptide/nickel transport system substrate-binding protein